MPRASVRNRACRRCRPPRNPKIAVVCHPREVGRGILRIPAGRKRDEPTPVGRAAGRDRALPGPGTVPASPASRRHRTDRARSAQRCSGWSAPNPTPSRTARSASSKPHGFRVGAELGDPLTDNSRRTDAYRFHGLKRSNLTVAGPTSASPPSGGPDDAVERCRTFEGAASRPS